MKAARHTRQFKKDVDLARKRRKDLGELKTIMTWLVEGKTLPGPCKDHALKGTFADYRECHIGPDWLLIYKSTTNEVCFIRTGTHSDLFK